MNALTSSRRALVAAAVASLLTLPSPAQEWKQYADARAAGWSPAGLERARALAVEIGSAAVLVVDHGHVVAAWGHVTHPLKSASIRKSLYDATMGAAHARQPFDVGTSLAELGIDDLDPLSDREKQATVEHLMAARSGVYHGAAYETPSNARRRPERRSAAPGTAWYYNNWDFNLVCTAFERLTGKTMSAAFAELVAGPLGMEDFAPHHLFSCLEPRMSRHPALTMRISARDLARVGQLYLQGGRWRGKQLVPADWVKRSTTPLTTFEEGHYRGTGNGYGRLWWVLPAREESGPYGSHHRIAAQGAGGQVMVLLPALDVVLVHRTDTWAGRGVATRAVDRLLDVILAARSAAPPASCTLGPLRVEKLRDGSPAGARTDLVAVKAARQAALTGRFMMNERMGVRLHRHRDRLFCQPLGMPMGNDVEMLQAPDGTLRSPIVNVVLRPVDTAGGAIDAVRMTFRGRTMTGRRVR